MKVSFLRTFFHSCNLVRTCDNILLYYELKFTLAPESMLACDLVSFVYCRSILPFFSFFFFFFFVCGTHENELLINFFVCVSFIEQTNNYCAQMWAHSYSYSYAQSLRRRHNFRCCVNCQHIWHILCLSQLSLQQFLHFRWSFCLFIVLSCSASVLLETYLFINMCYPGKKKVGI